MECVASTLVVKCSLGTILITLNCVVSNGGVANEVTGSSIEFADADLDLCLVARLFKAIEDCVFISVKWITLGDVVELEARLLAATAFSDSFKIYF